MRHAIEKSCNVYFYTLGNMLGVDRIHKWAREARPGGEDRHRSAERAGEHRALHRVEAEAHRREWYPGETISVAIGQGQVSVTPASLAVMISTVANGGTRVTPHVIKAVDEGERLEAGAAAGGRPTASRSSPRRSAALRDGLWMVVNGAGTGGRAQDRRPRRRGQDRHRAGDFERRAARAPRARTRTCATTAGSCSSRRSDNPEIAGVIFAEHGEHGYPRRADRQARDRDVFREEGRQAAAGAAAAARAAGQARATIRIPRRCCDAVDVADRRAPAVP